MIRKIDVIIYKKPKLERVKNKPSSLLAKIESDKTSKS